MRYVAVFIATLFSLLFCTLLLPAAKAGADDSPDPLLTQMAEKAAAIAAIDSKFTQTRYISFLDEELVSEGFFHFRNPGELIWQYEKPIRFRLEYINGQARFVSGNDDKNQGQNSRESVMAKAVAGQILPWIPFDVKKIRQTFSIAIESRSPVILHLTPIKNPAASPLKEMRVVFTGSDPDVSKLFIYEKDGDFTRLEFFDTKRVQKERP